MNFVQDNPDIFSNSILKMVNTMERMVDLLADATVAISIGEKEALKNIYDRADKILKEIEGKK
jgi:hypothetical protein